MFTKSIRIYSFLFFIKILIPSTDSVLSNLGWIRDMFGNEECREERQPVVEYYYENGMQYLFFSQRVTWEEARMLCRSYNSRLALLDTMEKALGVARSIAESNIVMEDTWLGGRRIDFVWYWIDKETGPWKNEISVEPNVEDYPPWSREPLRPTKECLAIDRRSHEHPNFIDLDCRLQRPFICEKKTGEITNNPIPSKWVQINQNTYVLYHGRITWREAAAFCRAQGSRLAILKSSMAINILTNSMTKARPDFEMVWIGAHYEYGQWVWMATGSVLSPLTDESGYPPWRFGRPEKNEGCLLLDRHIEENSTFLETTCDRKRDFICEDYSNDDEDDWMDEPVKFAYENSTYIIYPIHKTWLGARAFCNDRGSVLAYVEHMNVVDLITEAMGDHPRAISHVWLGGEYNEELGEWRWIGNNETIVNAKDEFGFPPWAHIDEGMETYSDSSYCLNLDRTDHVEPHFYGLECNSEQSYVCKITCDVPPPIHNGDWNCSDITNGRQCLLRCDTNLIMLGIGIISCTYRNGWISENNLIEFPICLDPKNFTTRMIRSLSQSIQKSSGYYIILDHSSSELEDTFIDFVERIVTSFPASHNLKFGMITHFNDPLAHLPFNQTNKCRIISAVRSLLNNNSKTTITNVNMSTMHKDISMYSGRRISIIAIIDSKRGSAYADALMQFKAAGHHIIIIGLREDIEGLPPLATIGFDGRSNLFLFEESELRLISDEIKKHDRKKPGCLQELDTSTNSESSTIVVENDLQVQATELNGQGIENDSASPSRIATEITRQPENISSLLIQNSRSSASPHHQPTLDPNGNNDSVDYYQ